MHKIMHIHYARLHQTSEWEEECEVMDFDCGMVVVVRQPSLHISESPDLLGLKVCTVYTEWCIKQNTFCEQQFCG